MNVKGGSPIKVKTISAWSPAKRLSPCISLEYVYQTFMDILIYPLSMANLCRRKRSNAKAKVRYGSFTRLLLVGNARDREFTRLLLQKGKWRDLRLLSVRFAIDSIPKFMIQQGETHGGSLTDPMFQGGLPSSWN